MAVFRRTLPFSSSSEIFFYQLLVYDLGLPFQQVNGLKHGLMAMPLTFLDMTILKTICQYYVLTREQIQKICSPEHSSGRGTRKRLSRLCVGGYINKHRVPVVLPDNRGAAPVYQPTKKGADLVAAYFDDPSFYATNTKHPRADRVAHWVAINNERMKIEAAIELLPQIQLAKWVTEWETINKEAEKKERYCLHTQISKSPPLSCSPDAAFLIEYQGENMVYYLEKDLGTSSPKQIAVRKSKGYAALAKHELHRKHFPETTRSDFRVLFVTTGEKRALATQKQMNEKAGKELWLMISDKRATANNYFTGEIALDYKGNLGPLLRLPCSELTASSPSSPNSEITGVQGSS